MHSSRACRSLFEATAIGIGWDLCSAAFWDAERRQCNWMGRTDENPTRQPFAISSAAIGPELYAGSAGVALFLTELYGWTREPEFRATAEGALRRSVQHLRSRPTPASPLSLFAGHLGVAYALARLSDLAPDAKIIAELPRLVGEAVDAIGAPHGLDLITGTAGTILALLSLSRREGFERCLDGASLCGEELCDAARWDGESCSWDAARASGSSFTWGPMTGLSHGASGIALALLELYARTGGRRLLDVARGAFAFEDGLFIEEVGNWIDVRHAYSRRLGVPSGACQTTWCHGAPGIGLARARAMKLDPERAEQHALAARAAARTTSAAICQKMEVSGHDATLCHGVAGLSGVLLSVGAQLGDASLCVLSADCMERLAGQYAAAADWPSGIHAGGPHPGLMIGAAGLGLHLLRQTKPGASAMLTVIP